jgi:hypothetical protein
MEKQRPARIHSTTENQCSSIKTPKELWTGIVVYRPQHTPNHLCQDGCLVIRVGGLGAIHVKPSALRLEPQQVLCRGIVYGQHRETGMYGMYVRSTGKKQEGEKTKDLALFMP